MGDLTGQTIKGYKLEEVVDQGGFGAIYRANQEVVGREVAIKVILPRFANRPDFIRRFEAEAHFVARLEHPHIVPIYDYWRDPDGAFLVMRWFPEGSLRTRLEAEPFELTQIVDIITQVTYALNIAHHQGVIHRDLKPGNILLDGEGNYFLTDFGIAKDLSEEVDLSTGAQVTGTPAYLSPEQGLGNPVTAQSDIYSFGVVLYELLSGEHPFPDANPTQQIIHHINDPLPAILNRNGALPKGLNEVIQKATAKQAKNRYETVNDLLTAFQHALKGVLDTDSLLVQPAAEFDTNPYKGLRAFEEADGDDFFGRDALVAQLIAEFGSKGKNANFLTLIGPSGSGKSSVVKAGLLPEIRKGAIKGSEQWYIAELQPGAHPFDELEIALLGVSPEVSEGVREQLERDERGLVRAAQLLLPKDDTKLLLVIDQFEELFTLVEDRSRQKKFLDLLLIAATDKRSRVHMLITLRADFFDKPLMFSGFGELVRDRSAVIVPLSAEELISAIVEPAKRVGVDIEPELVTEIVADVLEQPGALPMLQYAMTELYNGRQNDHISREEYHAIGGVLGALGNRAEEIHESLDEESQEITRQVFLRLVALGEGTEDTRRRVVRTELDGLSKDTATLDQVISTFGTARLLTFDRDPVTRNPTVEVAHEALLREWPRFRNWLEDSRTDVSMQRSLANASRDWKDADEDVSFLLSGARLDLFEGWSSHTDIALADDEQAFLTESLAERQVSRAKRAEREEREKALEKRSRQILRILVGVFAAATLVALYLTNFAFDQQRQAESNADIAATSAAQADLQSKLALSRELAAHAINLLDSDPELSILLSMQAISDVYTREAHSALNEALGVSRIELTIPGNGSALVAVAVSPDGKMFATAGDDPVINVWDTDTGELIITLPGRSAPFLDVAFHPGGEVLAATGSDGIYRLWNLSSGEKIDVAVGIYNTDDLYAISLAFSADGNSWAYAIARGGGFQEVGSVYLNLIEVKDDYSMVEIAGDVDRTQDTIKDIIISPDGSQLATTEGNGRVRIRSTASVNLPIITELPRVCDWADGIAYSPDGRILAVGCEDKIILWDVPNNRTITTMDELGRVYSISFNKFGSRFVTATNTGIRVWDVVTYELLYGLQGHKGFVNDVVYSPDGTRIISVSSDGTAKVWDVTSTESGAILAISNTTPYGSPTIARGGPCYDGYGADGTCPGTAYSHITLSPDADWFTTGSVGGILEIREFNTGELLHYAEFVPNSINDSDISFDNRLVATAWGDNIVRIYDPTSGSLLQELDGHRITRSQPTLPDGIQDVDFSPGSDMLASASLDAGVIIWDPISGEQIIRLSDHLSPVTRIEFSPKGDMLASTSAAPFPKLIIWDTSTWEVMHVVEGDESILGLAFSPDGSMLATSGANGLITVWDAEDVQLLLDFTGHQDDVVEIVFSPDGQLIATASSTGTKIWDANSGLEVFSFPNSNFGATGVSFHPDGQSLLVSLANGRIILHRLDVEYLLDLAHNRVTRSLTTQECRTYLYVDECP